MNDHFLRFAPVAGAFVAALLCVAGARAADAPGPAACHGDARSLCSQVEPGGGRIAACLKEHESQLSEACRTALPTMQRCAAEVQALCGSAGGLRERRACLRDQAAKLSPECRNAAGGR
ncbi:cysteine rich repeat-containing protein [Variovorax sp. YR752]|uniref:cysteine rich repeat-containing protein n=1 Tax=Variovorax sp. YR752 TaxID=1884383 RepID=UPI00313830EE